MNGASESGDLAGPTDADASAVVHMALGAIAAQGVVDGLRDGSITPPEAWLRFLELEALCGRNSPAARAFVIELAKRIG